MINVQLANKAGSVSIEPGAPVGSLFHDLPGVLTARIDGKRSRRVELGRPLLPEDDGATITPLTFADPMGNTDFQHSGAHLMAQAIKELWPNAKLTIGPPDVNEFFYDIERDPPFSPEEFPVIEAKMTEIAGRNLDIKRRELAYGEARALFAGRNETYKLELIDDLEKKGQPLSVYEQGTFVDLCIGPHIPNTGLLKAVKIMSVAGAYWHGDERNKQLSRLYGAAFPSPELLEAHLKLLAEAEKRDHRKIGKELGLFIFPDEAVPGMPLFAPKGAHVRMQLENYSREKHLSHDYQPVWTPQIFRSDLWKISGHLENYAENMYQLKSNDNQDYIVKPMNCPGHCLIFRSEGRSYRDLPLRFSELGLVYRQERSGTLHGILRVRALTQDDAHIFCMADQLHEELNRVVDFVEEVLRDFGFTGGVEAFLSFRGPDQKVVGAPELWDRAEGILRDIVTARGMKATVDPGEATFYGPKIDFKVKDAIGRVWQCSTVQLDFNLPQRFELEYTGADGNKHTPVMIHRALFGSVERFLGVLIEHHAGDFPVWLAPVQARVLSITSDVEPFAREVHAKLRAIGIRAELDASPDKIGYKIRTAEMQKVPYMLVVGKREAADGKVAVRRKGKGDQGASPVDDVVARIAEDIRTRAS